MMVIGRVARQRVVSGVRNGRGGSQRHDPVADVSKGLRRVNLTAPHRGTHHAHDAGPLLRPAAGSVAAVGTVGGGQRRRRNSASVAGGLRVRGRRTRLSLMVVFEVGAVRQRRGRIRRRHGSVLMVMRLKAAGDCGGRAVEECGRVGQVSVGVDRRFCLHRHRDGRHGSVVVRRGRGQESARLTDVETLLQPASHVILLATIDYETENEGRKIKVDVVLSVSFIVFFSLFASN